VQLLEYLDKVGLLERVGDLHQLCAECELFAA